MTGLCTGSDVGYIVGGTGSVCVVGDNTGIGVTTTAGGGRAANVDPIPFVGSGFIVSTGDIRDQNGPFTFESYEATIPVKGIPIDVVGTHSYGPGQQKQRVDTIEVLGMPGFGFGYTRGRSYTWTARWDIWD
jgi:hypothetical protein